MATSVTFCPPPILQFLGNNGQPLVGGSVLTQVGGINTATYQDSAGATPLPNPIPLNSRGEISNASGTSCQLFLAAGSAYTFTLKDASGNTINTALYVSTTGGVGTFTSPILVVSNTAQYVAQLTTNAGYAGLMASDQAAARQIELLFLGAAAVAAYGANAGEAVLNFRTAPFFKIAFNDLTKHYLDNLGNIGLGVSPTAAAGLLQLLGSANGGIQLGNVDNSNETAFDYYKGKAATVWTPVVRFGGSSVGITYGTQAGRYTRIGNMVFCRMRVVLTNKGSSTGTATIAGLPFTPAAIAASISEVIEGEFGLMTALGAGSRYALSGTAGSAVLTVVAYDLTGSSSAPITLSNTAFSSGSIIDLAFAYQAV